MTLILAAAVAIKCNDEQQEDVEGALNSGKLGRLFGQCVQILHRMALV